MKKNIFLLLILGLASCSTENECAYPECFNGEIELYIDLVENNSCGISKATIKKYSFQGNFVYEMPRTFCSSETFIQIQNEECLVLGSLGGLDNNEEIRGESFRENADFICNVWEYQI